MPEVMERLTVAMAMASSLSPASSSPFSSLEKDAIIARRSVEAAPPSSRDFSAAFSFPARVSSLIWRVSCR